MRAQRSVDENPRKGLNRLWSVCNLSEYMPPFNSIPLPSLMILLDLVPPIPLACCWQLSFPFSPWFAWPLSRKLAQRSRRSLLMFLKMVYQDCRQIPIRQRTFQQLPIMTRNVSWQSPWAAPLPPCILPPSYPTYHSCSPQVAYLRLL